MALAEPMLLDEDGGPVGRDVWPMGAILIFAALAAAQLFLTFHALRGSSVLGLQGRALHQATVGAWLVLLAFVGVMWWRGRKARAAAS